MSILTLPTEILQKILLFLPLKDICFTAVTSSTFYGIFSSKHFWTVKFKQEGIPFSFLEGKNGYKEFCRGYESYKLMSEVFDSLGLNKSDKNLYAETTTKFCYVDVENIVNLENVFSPMDQDIMKRISEQRIKNKKIQTVLTSLHDEISNDETGIPDFLEDLCQVDVKRRNFKPYNPLTFMLSHFYTSCKINLLMGFDPKVGMSYSLYFQGQGHKEGGKISVDDTRKIIHNLYYYEIPFTLLGTPVSDHLVLTKRSKSHDTGV